MRVARTIRIGSRRVVAVWQSFVTKLIIITIVFVAVPILIYDLMRIADAEKNALVLHTVQEEGRLVAEALFPHLVEFSPDVAKELDDLLPRLAAGEGTIKVLFRPAHSNAAKNFFFVSSYPRTSGEALEAERGKLVDTGLLSRVTDSCDYLESLAYNFTNAAGDQEVMTYLAARIAPNGCWAIITSLARNDLLNVAFNRPYWRTPEMQIAAAVYALMALLILSIFIGAWRNLRRFRDVAVALRQRRPQGLSFREHNRIPELAGVAADFDNLVSALQHSEKAIREAAEENAHALKGPLAVISQSIEPIRNSVTPDNERAIHGIYLIEQSIDRLDGLISAARRIEEATAEMLDKPLQTIDLPGMLPPLVNDFRPLASSREIVLRTDVASNLRVSGNDELLETAIENLLDNAIDFSPTGSTIVVSATAENDTVVISVEDSGPGVPEHDLERIFERSFSSRPSDRGANGNYGIGLWIVRRNVEVMGGSVRAVNVPNGGLRIEMRLVRPYARGHVRKRNV